VAASLDREPAEMLGAGREGQVAGVEAAVWCETVWDSDDLTFSCYLACPERRRKPGATREPPPGRNTATAWPDMAGSGRKTTSLISAPRRWTGYRAGREACTNQTGSANWSEQALHNLTYVAHSAGPIGEGPLFCQCLRAEIIITRFSSG
jgi:hypothetical protein